jgi:phosphohistidine swiveling domain-containing protein
VDKIYWLIEECKEYGTLPFAGVARAGFIAVQFLKSFVKIGIITEEEYNLYMNSLNTVNKQMNHDLYEYYRGEISKEDFLKKYGHIRPGTYDIMSRRYDEAFEEYFSQEQQDEKTDTKETYSFSADQLERIQLELDQNGLLVSAEELLTFIKESIEGREYLKFVFTKSVSEILKLIEKLGERAEIKKDDMAYLDISVVKQLYVDLYTGDIRNIFEENINHNKKQYESAIRIKLPSIIVEPENVYSFYLLNEEPNYITQNSVTAPIVSIGDDDYEGKIVFIQSADPGYDFLFSKNIAGLVTQFGGANSHMAIRCAELGIPAVIGAGERNFSTWTKYEIATLDCLKKQMIQIK